MNRIKKFIVINLLRLDSMMSEEQWIYLIIAGWSLTMFLAGFAMGLEF